MRVQTEEWRRFIPGVRMYKGKLTYFYNGEKLNDETNDYLVYNEEERQKWQVIMVLPRVEIIPRATFWGCKNVETVIMSDSVKRIEREIEDGAFRSCFMLIILSVPQHIQLGDSVIADTELIHCYPKPDFELFDDTVLQSHNRSNSKLNEWIKRRLNDYPLHKLCCREHPPPNLDSFTTMDWLKRDDCNLTPIDYFIANFGEGELMASLPEHVQLEKQCAWQQNQMISLQSQVAEQKHELDLLKKERDHFMSVSLLEEEIKCYLCYNKFSTDLNSTLPEIRQFLPVLSRAACPHYFCQGCVEKSQLAAADIAPRNKVPKWLKCMICKQKTAFCPEDPFYHTKLIELLERARRYHPIDVKVEEGHEAADTHSNSKDDRISKRAKVANVAIKEES